VFVKRNALKGLKMQDIDDFRLCLGKFATGVTIVSCADDKGRPYGVTANSFSSVSLAPPLILWNIAKVTQSLTAYLEASHFAVNILAAEQRDLSNHFAKSRHDLFEGIEFGLNSRGVPILPGTLACLECRTDAIHDCGDHYIIVGEVESFSERDVQPLLFYGGRYAAVESGWHENLTN